MCSQIVERRDLARPQSRTQYPLEKGEKYRAIGRAIHGESRPDTLPIQGRRHGQTLAIVLRSRADHTLAARGASVKPGHGRVETTFIDKDEPLRLQMRAGLPPSRSQGLNARSVLLAGLQRFFLRGKPSCCSRRQTVGALTRSRRPSSTSVASGGASTRAVRRCGFTRDAGSCRYGAVVASPVSRHREFFNTICRLGNGITAELRQY